jgi:hypothetical protein
MPLLSGCAWITVFSGTFCTPDRFWGGVPHLSMVKAFLQCFNFGGFIKNGAGFNLLA